MHMVMGIFIFFDSLTSNSKKKPQFFSLPQGKMLFFFFFPQNKKLWGNYKIAFIVKHEREVKITSVNKGKRNPCEIREINEDLN